MALSLPTVIPFDVHGDAESCGSRWRTWLARFNIYVAAAAITDSERKKALMLHCAGEAVQDIFLALPNNADLETYEAAVEQLTAHFAPRKNVDFEIFKFRQAKQLEGESMDAFHMRLRSLAKTCEFHNTEGEIKGQIIQTCTSSTLRRRALGEQDIGLEDILKMARIMDISEAQAKGIERSTVTSSRTGEDNGNDVETVNAIRKKKQGNAGNPKPRKEVSTNQRGRGNSRTANTVTQGQCYKCGFEYPHQSVCPAKGQSCNSCGKSGHFSRCCQAKQGKNDRAFYSPKRYGDGHGRYKQGQSNSGKVNSIQTKEVQNLETEDEYLFLVGSKKLNDQPKVNVKIAGMDIRMIMDTGATVNMVDQTFYNSIATKVVLNPSKVRVYSYGAKDPLPLLGSFESWVSSESTSTKTKAFFHVTLRDKEQEGTMLPIMGYQTLRELNLLGNIYSVVEDNKIEEEFCDLFQGIGKMTDHKVKLHIDTNVPPVARSHRRIPFHLRGALEKELDRLLEEDIIEPISGPTPWVSPVVIVPKDENTNDIRLCVDMREANQAILRERHVMPTVEEVIHEVNGSKFFTKLDLRKGYHQLELSEESKYITVFSTHKGLFQYKRLSFGISSAAEIFQNLIWEKIQDIPRCINISDDILIHGITEKEHDESLRRVLERLRDNNLTLNKEKCIFKKKQVLFYGHNFGEDGVSIDPSKIEAICNMSPPETPNEVRSLLGLATYCSRFLRNFSDTVEPLRQLTKKDAVWTWGPKEDKALKTLKVQLTAGETLSYFDPKKETVLYVDASPSGLGAILTQMDGQGNPTIIAYASKALSPVETRYSQTEREALAVVYGCEHFNTYVQGAPVEVVTDHLPLLKLLGKPSAKTSARIERWNLRLQPYELTLKFKAGKENPADYLSRHVKLLSTQESVSPRTEAFVYFVAHQAVPRAMTWTQIQEATKADKTLLYVMNCLEQGKWSSTFDQSEVDSDVVTVLEKVKAQLSIVDGVLLKEHRIIIPACLQEQVLNLAHEGHMGLVKTKQILRSKVWFYKIDKKVEMLINNCLPCLANNPGITTEPLKMSTLPEKPWEYLSIDFCGPFPGGEYILVLMDEHSRYPIVEIVRSTSAGTTISVLQKVFSMFGIPKILKSDNGPPFQSVEFSEFLKQLGIQHRKVTSYWPAANVTAERFMRTLVKAVRSFHCDGKSWHKHMHNFLMNYRNTVHSTTGRIPAELIFGRQIKTKLPSPPENKQQSSKSLLERDSAAKERMKMYSDLRRRAKSCNMKVGDSVLVRKKHINKLSTPYGLEPYQIVSIKGSMITAKNSNRSVTRNSSFFRRIGITEMGQLKDKQLSSPVQQTVNEDTGDNEERISTDVTPVLKVGQNQRKYRLRENVRPPRRLVEEL